MDWLVCELTEETEDSVVVTCPTVLVTTPTTSGMPPKMPVGFEAGALPSSLAPAVASGNASVDWAGIVSDTLGPESVEGSSMLVLDMPSEGSIGCGSVDGAGATSDGDGSTEGSTGADEADEDTDEMRSDAELVRVA